MSLLSDWIAEPEVIYDRQTTLKHKQKVKINKQTNKQTKNGYQQFIRVC